MRIDEGTAGIAHSARIQRYVGKTGSGAATDGWSPGATCAAANSENPNTEMRGNGRLTLVLSNEAAKRFVLTNKIAVGRWPSSRASYTRAHNTDKIEDQGRIDGNLSQEASADLALVSAPAALPAAIKYWKRHRRPTLGADSSAKACRPNPELVVVMDS